MHSRLPKLYQYYVELQAIQKLYTCYMGQSKRVQEASLTMRAWEFALYHFDSLKLILQKDKQSNSSIASFRIFQEQVVFVTYFIFLCLAIAEH